MTALPITTPTALPAPRSARVRARGRSSARLVEADGLGRHRAAWDALVDAAPVPSGFLKSWWLETTARREATYLLVLDGERLLGGLALERRRVLGVSWYTAVGGGRLCPDHLDLVAAPAEADRVAATLGAWFSGLGARVLDLDGVVEDARILAALPAARVERSEQAYYEPFGGSAEAYYAARSKTFTKRVRKRARRLDAVGIGFRTLPADQAGLALSAMRDLHAPRADRQPLLRHWGRVERAFLAAARAGEFHAMVAERDGEVCGVLLSMTTGGRLATYQVARRLEDEYSDVGTVLYKEAIEDACAAGMTEIDMLRGDETYKRSFAAGERALLRVRAAHGLRARCLLAVRRGYEALRAGVASARHGRGTEATEATEATGADPS